MDEHPDFGTEAERPPGAPRDYPVLIDRIREAALELALETIHRRDGEDARLRAILRGLVDLGDLARRALAHWPDAALMGPEVEREGDDG